MKGIFSLKKSPNSRKLILLREKNVQAGKRIFSLKISPNSRKLILLREKKYSGREGNFLFKNFA